VTNQDDKSVATYDVLTLVAKQWPPPVSQQPASTP